MAKDSQTDDAELDEALSSLGVTVHAQSGDVLIHQDETDDFAYRLVSGTVEVFIATSSGDIKMAEINAPAIIGEIAALARIPRTASVRARGNVELKRISADELQALGLRQPDFLLGIIEKLGQEKDTVNRAITLYIQALQALEQEAPDLSILETLSKPPPQLAVFASVFSRFAREIAAKRKTQEELASAAVIQQSFLPKLDHGTAWPGGVAIEAMMRPARSVGGDFFDLQRLDSSKILIVVGDVCGKGMPASLFMSVAITTIRSVARQSGDVGAMAIAGNELLSINNERSLFATAVIAILDTENSLLTYANCGHCPILHLSGSGALSAIGATGLPLGLFANRKPATGSISVASGDLLFFYSDGVTEAHNASLEEFGNDRLQSLVRNCLNHSATEVVSRVISETDQFASGTEQADDITCLAITFPKTSAPRL